MKKGLFLVAIVGLMLGLQGCGDAQSILKASTQYQGRCQIPPLPGFFDGTIEEGNYCEDEQDCLPNCCNCEFNETKSWIAVACVDNVCQNHEITCNILTRNDIQYCN